MKINILDEPRSGRCVEPVPASLRKFEEANGGAPVSIGFLREASDAGSAGGDFLECGGQLLANNGEAGEGQAEVNSAWVGVLFLASIIGWVAAFICVLFGLSILKALGVFWGVGNVIFLVMMVYISAR